MATVYANLPINLYSIDLHGLLGGPLDFDDNVGFESYLGNVYQDAYRTQNAAGTQRGYILGTGLTVNASGALTGGTAQALQQDSLIGTTWTPAWGIEGISIGAVTVANAILTPSAGDDLALIETMLSGADSIRLSPGNDNMRGFAGNDSIRGGAGNDVLYGDEGDDTVDGGSGDDRLYGGPGTNRLLGGAGNDTFYAGGGDTVVETSTVATERDTVRIGIDYTLPDNVEVLILDGSAVRGTGNALDNAIVGSAEDNVLSGGAGADVLRGSTGDDTLYGGSGNDTLYGELGADRMVGGAGNDSYVVDATGDVAVETSTLASEVDEVSAGVSHTLGDKVERLTLSGATAINGTGNAGANTIVGNVGANVLRGLAGNDQLLGNPGNDTLDGGSGNDTLDGGIGSDSMTGGSGNDRYQVDAAGDRVVETGTSATEIDTVWASVSFTLGEFVEGLLLQGDDPIAGNGNALANTITGNGAANRIDGRGGADTMSGGTGNDLYIVDHAGDQVIELAGGGADTVRASVSHTLANIVEVLTLTGAAAIDGTGNAIANRINGNAAANRIDGRGGADTMTGYGGNDSYVVDNVGDTLVEAAGGGSDTIITPFTTTLGANFENLTLTDSASVDGTGNTIANRINGNAAANRIDGGSGADTMVGGSGSDVYYVDQSGDVVSETSSLASEVDLVYASVTWTLGINLERLTLRGTAAISGHGNERANVITGNSGANTLYGNAGADQLSGSSGNDLLNGGTGNDTLVGGAGLDTLRFSTALNAASNVDRILDFDPADDRFVLEDAVFTAVGAPGALAASAFKTGNAATDASDRIVYDPVNGQLLYDADGVGGTAAILFATLTAGTAITAADFWVG